MSYPSFASGIIDLHPDILWSIFKLNINIFHDDSTPKNLRTASQVCQTWRNVIINSPSLWSEAIHLNKLLSVSQRSDSDSAENEDRVVSYSRKAGYLDDHPWLKEIMRRSGTSPLCIKVDGINGVENTLLALRLVDNEWRRIRKLTLILYIHDRIDATTWSPISRVAPILEMLHVSMMDYRRHSNLEFQLPFANSAPVLSSLKADAIVNIQPFSPWLGNLKYLCINHVLSVPDILKIIGSLSSIQTLEIHNAQSDSSDTYIPIAYLPGLKVLTLADTELGSASQLLNHIHLPSTCSLEANTYIGPDGETNEELSAYLHPFTKYARQFYQIYSPTKTGFGQFDDSDGDRPPHEFHTEAPDGSSHFKFSIQTYLRTSFPEIFIKTFSFPELSSTTDLSIYLGDAPDTLVSSFLPLMPSVTTLETNELCFIHAFNRDIRYQVRAGSLGQSELANINDNARISNLLPLLSILSIESLTMSLISGPRYLCRCLRDMHERRKPIDVLDLTKNPRSMSPNLSMLEEVSGLKVIWKNCQGDVEEYICGSGDPGKLPYSRDDTVRQDPLVAFISSLFGRNALAGRN